MGLSGETSDQDREFMLECIRHLDRVCDEIEATLRPLVTELREGRAERAADLEKRKRWIDRMDRLDPGGTAA